jgi:Nuclease A inhibitor-like protein
VNVFARIAKAVNRLFYRKEDSVDARDRIAKAANGLLFSSEADYPLEPFVWKDGVPFTPEALYTLTALPAPTPVTQVDFNEFFAPMLDLPDDPTPEARARVARFRSLVRVLRHTLHDLTVYKLGTIEMPTFIVGRLANGMIAGLRTTVVET